MRWALLLLALLLAVAGLLYQGGVAFVSTLSEATASLRGDGPAMVPASTEWVEAPMRPQRADQSAASGMSRPEPPPAPRPVLPSSPEDVTPAASEQRIFKSRKALETVDPREFLRQVPGSN